jgi:hypothetical protein
MRGSIFFRNAERIRHYLNIRIIFLRNWVQWLAGYRMMVLKGYRTSAFKG